VNWLVFILAFCIGALMGAFFSRLAGRSRPNWTAKRRLCVSASILPCFLGVLTLGGLAWILFAGPGTGENMQDLALIVTAIVGSILAGLAFLGGFVGASLEARGGRP
jgi:prolipoprotein diacylglyceryltransferase